MLTCEKVAADRLAPADVAEWHSMLAATPAFQSPLLTPEFAQLIASVRDDVQVCVFRRGGKAMGFLAVHMRPGRFARPAGAPFADYSALITFSDPGFTAAEALAIAGIAQYQAIGLIDPHGVFGEVEGEADHAYAIDLSDDAPENFAGKKTAKNLRRLTRNLIETHGELSYLVNDRDPARFDAMVALKRRQTRETGLHDFLKPAWVAAMLERLRQAPESGLHGFMLTLMAGDTPITSHFGVRLGERVHPWISTYDPAFAAFSPGQVFLNELHEPLRAAGITWYDLSTGQTSLKASFSNTGFPVTHARVRAVKPAPRRTFSDGFERQLARIRRRFDHIATLELDMAGRLRGFAFAVASAPRRHRSEHG